MKVLRTLSMIAVLLGTSVAFAEAPAKKEDKEVSQADAEKFLAFFNKFVDAIVQNKDNCPKMASAINTVIDANLDIIKKANEAKAQKKDLPKPMKEKMMARVKETMPAMAKCGEDAEVKKAIERMKPPKKDDKAEK